MNIIVFATTALMFGLLVGIVADAIHWHISERKRQRTKRRLHED